MAPPLLLLTDIRVSLGSVPLLDGAGIGVGAGERICPVSYTHLDVYKRQMLRSSLEGLPLTPISRSKTCH